MRPVLGGAEEATETVGSREGSPLEEEEKEEGVD